MKSAISSEFPIKFREALNKLARAGSVRFFVRQKNGKQWNTVCISCFSFCVDGEKDPLSSRKRFIQRFPSITILLYVPYYTLDFQRILLYLTFSAPIVPELPLRMGQAPGVCGRLPAQYRQCSASPAGCSLTSLSMCCIDLQQHY